MADRTSLETELTRAECDERLRGRIDRRTVILRMDPTRPVRGRSSLAGFVLRRSRDAIVDARGVYLLGSQGGTRIDVRFALAWRSQLWWMAVNVVVLGLAGGIVLAGSSRIPGGPITVIAVAAGTMGAFMLVLQITLVLIASLVYGPRQRAFLRSFIEETLAAR